MATLTERIVTEANGKALDAIRFALENPYGADSGEKYINMWYEINDALLRVGR